MPDSLQSILVGTAGLSVLALVSSLLAAWRGVVVPSSSRRIKHLVLIGTFLHLLHFTEESRAGFYQLFPKFLGLSPWSLTFFLTFNILCAMAWLACLPLIQDHKLALIPIWFLALGSALNGFAHPLLSLAAGGYFPGLWTSPLVGGLGFLLIRDLVEGTWHSAVSGAAVGRQEE